MKFKLEETLIQEMMSYADGKYLYIKRNERINVFFEHLIIQAFSRFNPTLDKNYLHKIKIKKENIVKLTELNGFGTLSDFIRKKIWDLIEKGGIIHE
jgi:hypothetical protein